MRKMKKLKLNEKIKVLMRLEKRLEAELKKRENLVKRNRKIFLNINGI